MAKQTINEWNSIPVFQCIFPYQQSGLDHGAIKWAWEFFEYLMRMRLQSRIVG
jgi:hypothetical protein